MNVAVIALTLLSSALAEECPKDKDGWLQWRSQLIQNLQHPNDLIQTDYKGLKDQFALPRLLSSVDLLDSCAKKPEQAALFKDTAFLACMNPLKELRDLIARFKGLPAIRLDMDVANNPLAADFKENTELPAYFSDPKFLKAAREAENLEDVLKITKNLNAAMPTAKAVEFVSNFDDNLEKSVVVYLPGKNVDRWIHMANHGTGIGNPTLMVAIQKTSKQGKAISPPKAFYSVHFVQPLGPVPPAKDKKNDAGPHAIPVQNLVERLSDPDAYPVGIPVKSPEACVACHRTGPMPIVPKAGTPVFTYTPQMNSAQILEFLQGQVTVVADAEAPGFDKKDLGPSMGPVDPPGRTADFIRECAFPVALSKERVRNIATNMNCAQCHAPRSVAMPLGYPLGTKEFKVGPGLLEIMIKSGHMPPPEKIPLSVEDRDILFKCLVQEYYGGFQSPELGGSKKAGILLKKVFSAQCPLPSAVDSAPPATEAQSLQ